MNAEAPSLSDDATSSGRGLQRARPAWRFTRVALATVAAAAACARTVPMESTSASPSGTSAGSTAAPDAAPLEGPALPPGDAGSAGGDAGRDGDVPPRVPAEAVRPLARERIDGPHEELALDAGRPIYYALPRDARGPLRLVAHLHGMCGAPSYACGAWLGAGAAFGLVVCPTGNARCGDPAIGPPSWEAASWTELVGIMDRDLELSVARIVRKHPAALGAEDPRAGAILTGYSRGAYAAPAIARAHPNRWRHLVLIEANVALSAAGLQGAGVRSVALVAGEQGTEIAGMRKTEAELSAAGYPAMLFVMQRTGHLYSADMEDVMSAALSYVVAHDAAADAGR